MYKQYNTNQLSLELNIAWDIPASHEALFIDGTKVEADANKYSFTWKKAVERYDLALNDNISVLYDQLVQESVNTALSREECLTSTGLGELLRETESVLDDLEKAITQEPNVIKGGSANKQKRRRINKLRRKLKEDYLVRKHKYEESREILQERNSYSKNRHRCYLYAYEGRSYAKRPTQAWL